MNKELMKAAVEERLFAFEFRTKNLNPVSFTLWVWGTVLTYDDTRRRACLMAPGCSCLTK